MSAITVLAFHLLCNSGASRQVLTCPIAFLKVSSTTVYTDLIQSAPPYLDQRKEGWLGVKSTRVGVPPTRKKSGSQGLQVTLTEQGRVSTNTIVMRHDGLIAKVSLHFLYNGVSLFRKPQHSPICSSFLWESPVLWDTCSK